MMLMSVVLNLLATITTTTTSSGGQGVLVLKGSNALGDVCSVPLKHNIIRSYERQ